MSRPTSMKVDGTVYWTIMTYDENGVLVDADSTPPTVAVRKERCIRRRCGDSDQAKCHNWHL